MLQVFLKDNASFGQEASEEKIFWNSTNQKQELLVVAMFVNGAVFIEELP
jgi:hypothetical protein